MMPEPRVIVKPTPADVALAAAELFRDQANEVVNKQGVFSVALSGGSTPAALFKLLAQPPFVGEVPWEKTAIFWGDERAVPPDHPDSNFGTAKELLLDKVPIRKENIFRIPAELDPRLAAARYEAALNKFFGSRTANSMEADNPWGLDLIFLGMGVDGHTASLFPYTRALDETSAWVVGNYVETLETWRITLTVPFINRSRRVVFLVTGEGKKTRLKEVLEGPFEPDALPSQFIRPEKGELLWLVDEAAAELLDR